MSEDLAWFTWWLRAQDELERLILSTPSGEVRNLLTEANIKLMQARDKKQAEVVRKQR